MKAFPRADGKFDSSKPDEQGMDLRDYFAADIMKGMLEASSKLNDDNELSFGWASECGVTAEVNIHGEEKDGTRFKYTWARYYAEEAYLIADAMMKAREQ